MMRKRQIRKNQEAELCKMKKEDEKRNKKENK